MLVIDWDPNIFSIGPFTVAWHGLLTALGVLIGLLITVPLAQRKGYSEEDVYGVALWAIPGGVVGARLFHVLDHLDYYLARPVDILALTTGGLAFYGAIIGGIAAGLIYARIKGLAVFPFLDAITPSIIIAHSVGRVGCLINGDSYGSPTDLPWGIVYTNPGAFAPLYVAGHPFPIYEIMLNLAILALVWRLWGRLRPDGMIFLSYASLYALGRFLLTFLRDDPVVFLGLREAHLVSLAWLVVAIPLMAYRTRRRAQVRVAGTLRRRR